MMLCYDHIRLLGIDPPDVTGFTSYPCELCQLTQDPDVLYGLNPTIWIDRNNIKK